MVTEVNNVWCLLVFALQHEKKNLTGQWRSSRSLGKNTLEWLSLNQQNSTLNVASKAESLSALVP